METLNNKKTREIQSAMSALGRRIKAGDDSALLHWVIQDSLACAQRPLRYHDLYGGSGLNLSVEATSHVVEWAQRIKELGIKSIISLMYEKELGYYDALELGSGNLLDFYRRKGFIVTHLPWEDPHHKKTTEREKERKLKKIRVQALNEYDRLTKPVMIQCSAGIDRSAPVAAYIYVNRSLDAK